MSTWLHLFNYHTIKLPNYLICLLIFLASTAAGQTEVRGFVFDSFDQQPIEGVAVSSRIQKIGTTTDSTGRFTILVKSLPVELNFARPGFSSQKIRVSDSLDFIVFLQPNSLLEPVVIYAEKEQRMAGNKTRSIWNYAWLDDQLVVCDYGTSLDDARLVYLTLDGDTISYIDCPVRPVDMFNDCLGGAHLQGKDSTYQFYYHEGKMGYLPAEANFMINFFLRRCAAEDDYNLYFAIQDGDSIVDNSETSYKYRSANDEMWYFRGSKELADRYLFCKITDDFTKRMKKEEGSYGISPLGKTSMESAQSLAASRVFFDKIMIKEIYAPLYCANDSVYIIDHINNGILRFDHFGNYSSKVPIYYSGNKNFKRQCFQDPYTARVYVRFEKSGITFLRELNLQTGALGEEIRLPHVFLENISIRNGFVYYLHRDDSSREDRLLSRYRL
ncbi:MAG: hypothetical protein RL204_1714 [Bacteroidota bacterium]